MMAGEHLQRPDRPASELLNLRDSLASTRALAMGVTTRVDLEPVRPLTRPESVLSAAIAVGVVTLQRLERDPVAAGPATSTPRSTYGLRGVLYEHDVVRSLPAHLVRVTIIGPKNTVASVFQDLAR